ncbi:hypothetical protein MLD38_034870 [Melastoma candidum]|uniref:Uncharacterized protein n=1 Tax=Melastoma candidum TaxID=119954 RepID=A0ACB9MF44_9MYRT|nr:hypothetical protein MLD38_034870 [Melastoma candidum]
MKSSRWVFFWLMTLVLVLISLGSAFGRREEPASGNAALGSGLPGENRQGSHSRGVSLDGFSSSKRRVPNASDPLHNRARRKGSIVYLPWKMFGESSNGPDAAELEFGNLDENVLFEVLKHVDAQTLARCACVSKTRTRTSRDERLWEMVCTRHRPCFGCGSEELRSVVIALGGFRRLYSLYLLRLKQAVGSGSGTDEAHLFLSLLCIGCYEKMNLSSRGRRLFILIPFQHRRNYQSGRLLQF